MTDLLAPAQLGRSARLDQVLAALLSTAPELEAAAVVSFDGLPMASALPEGMDEDRVAAMSAALLSLGDRAAQGLGRGDLSQVYVEGRNGTVFLVSADDEAVLVAVAAKAAKVGLMLFEVRRAALAVAAALVADDLDAGIDPYAPLATHAAEAAEQVEAEQAQAEQAHAEQAASTAPAYAPPGYAAATHDALTYEVPAQQAPPRELPTYPTLSVPPPPYAGPAPVATAPVSPAAAAAAPSDPTGPVEPGHSGGPVMVPAGAAPDASAPDPLDRPQVPTPDQGWA